LLIIAFAFSQCNNSTKPLTEKPAPKPTPVIGVHFEKGEMLQPILEKAEKENKLVFVDFYTSWCLPCKLMDEEVFPNKNTGEFMNERFINFKVDAEKGNGPNLAFIFQVKQYPTLLFLDPKGRVLERKVGAAFNDELQKMGLRAIQTFEQDSTVNR
jgi:thiol:disulfide interchange protein